jgi:hypothetical protein
MEDQEYQRLVRKIAEGQERLSYLEETTQANKKLMLIITVLAVATVVLNRSCSNERHTK